jgi:hypothetical protein
VLYGQKIQKFEGTLEGFQKLGTDNYELILRHADEMEVLSFEVRRKDEILGKVESKFAEYRGKTFHISYKENAAGSSTYYKGLYVSGSFEEKTSATKTENSTADASANRPKTNVFWKKIEGDAYQLLANEKEILWTSSQWYDEDLIVYNGIRNAYYWLKDYKKGKDDELYEVTKILNAPIVWSKKGEFFWLFVGKQRSHNAASFWSGDDLVVYDFTMRKNFLLPNYKNATDGEVEKGEVLAENTTAIWKVENKVFSFYVEGNYVDDELTHTETGDDLVSFRPQTGITYYLKNYKKLQDGKYHGAKEL